VFNGGRELGPSRSRPVVFSASHTPRSVPSPATVMTAPGSNPVVSMSNATGLRFPRQRVLDGPRKGECVSSTTSTIATSKGLLERDYRSEHIFVLGLWQIFH
jgi:hypothetical protein